MQIRKLLIAIGFVAASNGVALPAWGFCRMAFDDPEALGAVPNFAADSFIFQPYDEDCDFYRMHLSTMIYNEWHLFHEDTTIGKLFCILNGQPIPVAECGSDCTVCGATGRNCTCTSPDSNPPNTWGKRLNCPQEASPVCEGVDHRQMPRTATTHAWDETFTFSVPSIFGGVSVGHLPITSACTPDGCIGTAGVGFRPTSIHVVTGPIRIIGVRIALQNLQVSVNPPVTVTIPILSASEIPSAGPGAVDLRGFGVVDRLLFASSPSNPIAFTIDNISIDISPFVGSAMAELANWTAEGGAPLAVNTTLSTNGGSSFVVPAAGWNVLRPPVVNTANQDRIGSSIAFDVFIPSAQANPSWIGDAQLSVSVPSAGIANQSLGSQNLTGKPLGAWSTLEFPVDAQLRQALLTPHADVQFSIGMNLSSNLQPTLVDFFRYAGTFTMVPPMGTPPSACNEATAVNLGAANTTSTVAANACVKITTYPGSWVHTIQLQPQAAGQFPLPFSWSNCSGSGQASLPAAWQQQGLSPVSPTCPTVIQLGGPASGTATLSWWGNG